MKIGKKVQGGKRVVKNNFFDTGFNINSCTNTFSFGGVNFTVQWYKEDGSTSYSIYYEQGVFTSFHFSGVKLRSVCGGGGSCTLKGNKNLP